MYSFNTNITQDIPSMMLGHGDAGSTLRTYPYKGMKVSVMKKQEAAAGTSSVKERVLKAYEVPVVLELGAVEDLTWTGSADFYVST